MRVALIDRARQFASRFRAALGTSPTAQQFATSLRIDLKTAYDVRRQVLQAGGLPKDGKFERRQSMSRHGGATSAAHRNGVSPRTAEDDLPVDDYLRLQGLL